MAFSLSLGYLFLALLPPSPCPYKGVAGYDFYSVDQSWLPPSHNLPQPAIDRPTQI